MKKITLSIDGMTCSACSNGLEKYLNKQEGILNATVNLVLSTASITYDEKKVTKTNLDTFIKKAGFQSLGEFKEMKVEKKNKKEKILLLFFTILALFFLYISMGPMLHIKMIPFFDMHAHPKNYVSILLILTLFFLFYGRDILKNGYKNLIHKTPNMDTLVGIGVLTSFFYSLYNLYLFFQGNSAMLMHLYFESSAIVLYFVKLGRVIDYYSKDKTKRAIQKLVEITPDIAYVKRGKTIEKVTLDEIKKGDILVCSAGEKIAVDGEIVKGNAHFDESFITGESKPIFKEKGQKVIAGSLNYDGYLEYQAEKIGKESTISEIVRFVIEASNTKAPISKIADKVSGIFVPIVLILAFVTFLVSIFLGKGIDASLITFVTILVVACPCSLGLATPLAIVVSEGVCASHGILIKKSEILEIAQKTTTVVFDKTGTLTYGTLKIAHIKNFGHRKNDEILTYVGSLEGKTTHPIGKAFVEYLENKKIKPFEVQEFQNKAGYGIMGKVKNHTLIVGNAKLLQKYKIKNTYQQEEQELLQEKNSILYVVIDQKIEALIGVNDIVRKESKELIDALHKKGIRTIMLTGDHEQTAMQIANFLHIEEVYASVLPKEKEKLIQKLKEEGQFVLMCGDGINDSIALTSADIGLSISSGVDVAMDVADVLLTNNDLKSILQLFLISKRTMRVIKQNLFWAFFYNSLMLPIAMGLLTPIGITINPMLASLAMVFSSLTVVLNTLKLRRIKNGRIS